MDVKTSSSPFHPGEQAIQRRLGVREQAEALGRQMIRPYMPTQHREFFAALSYLPMAASDPSGQPWASLLAGTPGFIASPDERSLQIRAHLSAEDPLHSQLRVGNRLGMLGIDLATRRRNRVNGWLRAYDGEHLDIAVTESFGNCPRYIVRRQAREAVGQEAAGAPQRGTRLDASTRKLISGADTFFIASYFPGDDQKDNLYLQRPGADISHRGGAPGFVQVASPTTLLIPDYAGNRHFNTLGNLLLNPATALLFVDFAHGHLLHLRGHTEILWQPPDPACFPDAERLLRFDLKESVFRPRALPLHWQPAFENPNTKRNPS